MSSFFLLFSGLYIIFFFMFFIGLFGIIFNYKNIIISLLSIELSLLSINLIFIYSSLLFNDFIGIFFSIIILTVAAAEAAIGLSILVLFYKVRGSIIINNKFFLRG